MVSSATWPGTARIRKDKANEDSKDSIKASPKEDSKEATKEAKDHKTGIQINGAKEREKDFRVSAGPVEDGVIPQANAHPGAKEEYQKSISSKIGKKMRHIQVGIWEDQ